MNPKIKGTAFTTILTSYLTGIEVLDQFNEGKYEMITSSMLNLCFSIELAIKSILTMKNIKFSRTHDLSKLFNLLPVEYKKQIIDKVLEAAKMSNVPMLNNKDDFYKDLAQNSSLYVNLRYFEMEGKSVTFKANFITIFSDIIVQESLLAINPKYKPKDDTVNLLIKNKREQLNLTLEELASKISLNPLVLKNYESNFKNPSLKMLIKISQALNVRVDDLIYKE